MQVGFNVAVDRETDDFLDDGVSISYTDPRVSRTLWMSPVATVITDASDGLIHNVNASFCDLVGYRLEDLVGKRTTELGIWADDNDRKRIVAAVTGDSRPQNFEFDVRTSSGETRTVVATIARVDLDGQLCLVEQMYDLTERRQTEDRLRLTDRIARIGYESTTYSEILERSLATVQQAFPSVQVGYGSLENRFLNLEASSGPPEMPSINGAKVDLRTAPEYEMALMRGEPIVVSDVREDPRFREMSRLLLELGVYGVLDVPVQRGDETVGVLFLESPTPSAWKKHQIVTLTEIAALLAVSLFRARRGRAASRTRAHSDGHGLRTRFPLCQGRELAFTRVNKAVATFHGYDNPDDFIGMTDFDLFPASLAGRIFADEQKVIVSGVPSINQLEPQNIEESIWTLTSTVPFRGADGSIVGVVGTSRDVSERQAMEAALRTSESRQRALLEAIPDIVFRIERDGKLLDIQVNRQSVIWIDPSAKPGSNLADELPTTAVDKIIVGIQRSLEEGVVTAVEYEIAREESTQTFEMRIAPCGDDQVVAIARDVTERKTLEKRLSHQATHDPLTGLPNRHLFANRLNEALEHARADQTSVAVLFIDLDGFKHVNDTFGHAAGDRMLAASPTACAIAFDRATRSPESAVTNLQFCWRNFRWATSPKSLQHELRTTLPGPFGSANHRLTPLRA